MEDRFGKSKFLLKKQYFKLLGHNFRVYDEAGSLVLFSHQKAFKLKEDIRVYADEEQTQELLSIQARQILDFSAAYDVVDTPTGKKLGALKRKGWKSLIRDNWIVMDAFDNEIGQIIEDSMALALLRRLLENLVPQKFLLTVHDSEAVRFRQHFNPFLYKLDVEFTFGSEKLINRRLGIAAAILLAAIEGRQKN